MISTFTELNRKRPPLDHLDFIGFTTVALIHACDDASVIEGLEALPSIARSARTSRATCRSWSGRAPSGSA